MIDLAQELPQSEVVKIMGYLESGEEGKKNIAINKIDRFIQKYLICAKYDYRITKIDEVFDYLQIARQNLINTGEDNIVIQMVIERFLDYKNIKSQICKLADGSEKEKNIRLLKSRNLWDIKQ